MKRKIVICMGSSCFARGNEENLRVIEDFLKSNNLQVKFFSWKRFITKYLFIINNCLILVDNNRDRMIFSAI